MAVWSIQQPLIESYHEALVGCLVPFLELQPDLAEVVFKAIAAAWPRGFNSNTPKVGLAPADDSGPGSVRLFSRLSTSCRHALLGYRKPNLCVLPFFIS